MISSRFELEVDSILTCCVVCLHLSTSLLMYIASLFRYFKHYIRCLEAVIALLCSPVTVLLSREISNNADFHPLQ